MPSDNIILNKASPKIPTRKSLSAYYSYVSGNDEEINDELSSIQIKLRELKFQISSQSKANFSLDRDLRYLDNRIALLIQNRMASEEMKDLASHLDDTKSENRRLIPSEQQLHKYGNLFFLLQSEPVHIATLTRLVNLSDIDTLLQTVMFTLYGNQYESREENLLLTMFQLVLAAQFEMTSEFSSLLRANTPVSRMMMTYTRRGPGQSYLKNVIAPEINLIIEDSNSDLEINPLKVLEELHRSSGKPIKKCLPEEALNDKDVIEILKPRISKLISTANIFLDAIIGSLDSVPYGIRWICKQIKSLTRRRYPNSTDKDVCSLIGGFFFLRFLNPAIVTPQAYMLIDADPTQNPRRTLTLIAKMLQNLANKPSYSKEAYMECLQPFVEANQDRILKFLFDLTDVGDFYDSLEMDQYMALTRKQVTLSISINEIYNTHSLLQQYIDVLSPLPNSKLRLLVQDLGECHPQVPRSENLNVELDLYSRWETPLESTLESMTFQNELTLHDIMYMEAKSILVQILRSMPQLGVISNDGNNLSNKKLRKTEFGGIDLLHVSQQAATSRDSILVRKGIKVREMLHELESSGVISSSNGFLNLSDEIVLEIEHLGSVKEQLETEYANLSSVYKTIQDHNEYLQSQLETYRAYLENARIQAGNASGQKSKKKNPNAVPSGVSLVQPPLKDKKNSSTFGFGERAKNIPFISKSPELNFSPKNSPPNHSSPLSRSRINLKPERSNPAISSGSEISSSLSQSQSLPIPDKLGKYCFSHKDLEAMGVIITSNVPKNRRVNLTFLILCLSPSTYTLEIIYKGRDRPILFMNLILDDLLARKNDNLAVLDMEYVHMDISNLIDLLKRCF
ncbi:GTPase-activating protein [Smittium culicis]|uniref:GTPase-activating protein n=1 Tax=Smittium culicis TaxID=133412 RepID=A0A1R1XLV6_9FUNG|nr:GTPase-activating protein [Smittium culicis]OMJ15607.1 GTPase-activating protein [Smittium culicis]